MAEKSSESGQFISDVISKSTHLNHLKQVQSFLVVAGLSHSPFLCFKLLRFCTLRLSNITYARFFFDRFSHPNTHLYAAVLTAYSSSLPLHAPSAFSFFRLMVNRSVPRPNHFIYPLVLKSTPHLSSSDFSTPLVHSHLFKSGFGSYLVVQTALLHAYASSVSHIPLARQVFDEMSERNVVSWTALLSGYARSGDVSNAIAIFDEMLERDVPSWNAVLAACTQNGLFAEAVSLFGKMINEASVSPNEVTLVCVLSACAQTGNLRLAKGVHAFAYRRSLASDVFVSNSLVDLYGKCGSLVEARYVFKTANKKSLTAWNSMINCFALHGRSEEAIAVFEEMMMSKENVKPDHITFIGLLNACTHGGLVTKGREYLDLMTNRFNIEARIEHYGCLIDLLGRAGLFDEALEVMAGMKMKPDEAIWGSLLNACRKYGRLDLAGVAVNNLVALNPDNGGYISMMANLYGEMGNWEEARKARKMIKHPNAYKTPGCSWITIDGKVNQFYSLDKSHPKSEEIYMILDSLMSL